jgi:outer membrane protein assembly factor BamB
MVVDDGLVIGSGDSAANGATIAAHQVSTGKLVWQQGYPCLGGQAVVVGGLVIFGACNKTTEAGFIQADNLTTGARVWRRAGNWVTLRGDLSTAAGTNVFASVDGAISDLNPATGATKYTLPDATSVLAVSASEVFTDCTTGGVCAYNLSDGTELWSVSDTSALAAEAGGVLYLADGLAVNASTGAQLRTIWTSSSPAPAALAVGEGRIAVANGAKTLEIYGLPGS